MRRRLIRWSSVAAVLVAAASAPAAEAETCALQIKRLESATARTTGPPTDQMFRGMYPQRFFRQTGLEIAGRPGADDEAEFAKVITKQPASYNSKSPFRAVAKLGTQQFGFVIDSRKAEEPAAEPAKEAAKDAAKTPRAARPAPALPAYGRLLFDVNHNGDLTDDPVIEAQATPERGFPAGYLSFSFPRVDLTVEADGTKIDYAFTVDGYGHSQVLNENQTYQYVSVSLNAAAYREGEITLDGKKTRIVVTDYNSNGRFDDLWGIDESISLSDGTVYPRQGDVMFVDPQAAQGGLYGYDPTMNDAQQFVAKAVQIGGRFYTLRITPAGDTLTLEPSQLAVGQVSNPNRGYRALVYGDLGILKVSGDADGRAPLPVGAWKLLMYSIDRTGIQDPAQPAAKEPSLLQSLANALLRRETTSGPTMVSARAKRDYPAVQVKAGETAELKFGAPYRAEVTASGPVPQGAAVSLGLSLVGAGGEVCSNLMVDGGRPDKPQFTITDPDGKVVQQGSFEYG